MNKQKGNSLLIVIVVVALAVVAVVWFLKNNYKGLAERTPQETSAPAITNKAELNTASSDLDGTDVNSMDKELDQLNTDSLSF